MRELTQNAELFSSATAAREALFASSLPIGNSSIALIQAALLRG
jgi:hypothetical protein